MARSNRNQWEKMMTLNSIFRSRQSSLISFVGCVLKTLMVTLCSGAFGNVMAQKVTKVSSVTELQSAMEQSDQHIVMQPGDYVMAQQSFTLSGDHNTVDLTGAYFSWIVGEAGRGRLRITGEGNTIRNGEFEDLYYNGMTEVTDFTAYNQDRNRLANGGQ